MAPLTLMGLRRDACELARRTSPAVWKAFGCSSEALLWALRFEDIPVSHTLLKSLLVASRL